MIGRENRGFVARDYWVWLIFEGLQNLVEKVEKAEKKSYHFRRVPS
jgi:hypothetical protein